MKKILASLVLMAAALPAAHAQVSVGFVDLNFTLGVLTDSSGNPFPDDSLIQVLASYSGNTFTSPSLTSFTGGDSSNGILWQGSFDSLSTGVDGAMSFSLSGLSVYAQATSGAFLKEGDALLVRWFPSLSALALHSAPGAVSYGQFGFGSGDDTWLVPEASFGVDLTLLTTAADGSLDNAYGQASLSIPEDQPSVTPVPEPSTYGLLGASALSLAVFARHRFRRCIQTTA